MPGRVGAGTAGHEMRVNVFDFGAMLRDYCGAVGGRHGPTTSLQRREYGYGSPCVGNRLQYFDA